MFKKIIAIIGICSFIATFLFISHGNVNVSSQNQTQIRGLILSPALQEIETEPGQSYQIDLDIRNDTTDKTYNLIHTTSTFEAVGEEGVPVLKDFGPDDQQKTWIGYPEPLINLEPGQGKITQVTLSIPKEATPGAYYFALIIGETPKQSTDSNQVLINSSVGTLLFVNVLGDIDKQVSFDQFELDKQIYDPFFDSMSIKYKIRVTGNAFLRPSGNIFIGTQESTGAITLNPDKRIILPNSARQFQTFIPADHQLPGFSSETSNNLKSRNIEAVKKPWFGQKDIEAKIIYTDANQDVSQQIVRTKVIFFPWKSLLLVLILIGLLVLMYYIYKIISVKIKESKKSAK